MSKSKKSGFNTVGVAIADALNKPYASGIEAGDALGAATESMLQVSQRMAVTIGAAYNKSEGFPQWGRLESALTETGAKVTKVDIGRGMAKRFDAMYLAANPTSTDKAKVEKTKALFGAINYTAAEFAALTPQAKAALGKGNPAKAEKVQECSDMLNKYCSAAWSSMVAADNRYHGRTSRQGRDEHKSVHDIVKGCKLGDVPARVGKLVADGIDVDDSIRQLAALIVKLKLANTKK